MIGGDQALATRVVAELQSNPLATFVTLVSNSVSNGSLVVLPGSSTVAAVLGTSNAGSTTAGSQSTTNGQSSNGQSSDDKSKKKDEVQVTGTNICR